MTRLLNIQQVMNVFGVKSRSTIYNWVDEGKLPKPNKSWGSPRWDEEEIKKMFKGDSEENE